MTEMQNHCHDTVVFKPECMYRIFSRGFMFTNKDGREFSDVRVSWFVVRKEPGRLYVDLIKDYDLLKKNSSRDMELKFALKSMELYTCELFTAEEAAQFRTYLNKHFIRKGFSKADVICQAEFRELPLPMECIPVMPVAKMPVDDTSNFLHISSYWTDYNLPFNVTGYYDFEGCDDLPQQEEERGVLYGHLLLKELGLSNGQGEQAVLEAVRTLYKDHGLVVKPREKFYIHVHKS
ncbi:MAG TPA: hypothetical protein VN611_09890 [Patescibacteria group bacterium]|nr:hypothetical protein [Patescibacteria group bacterium]